MNKLKLLILFLILGSSAELSGQEYYSKVFRSIGDRIRILYTHMLEEEGEMLISVIKREQQGSNRLGWFRTDLYGEPIDSFFYHGLHGGAGLNKISALKGDTLFQVLRDWDPDHPRLIEVFGSSVSGKDSLFRWTYDMWEIMNNAGTIRQESVIINSNGNLVIICQHLNNGVGVILLEITLEGEIVRKKYIHKFNMTSGTDNVGANILEKDGLYYVLPTEFNSYRVLCFTEEGKLQWVSDPREWRTDLQRSGNEIAFNHDSTELYVMHYGFLEFEDFFPPEYKDSLKYLRLFQDTVHYYVYERLQISVYDLAGNELRRHTHLMKLGEDTDNKETAVQVITGMTSKYNGDLMVVGVYVDFKENRLQYNLGLYFRMSADGTEKRLYKVLDTFGHPYYTFGAGLSGINEDSEGNVYLSGWIHNSWKPPYENAGWLLRLGLDPCEGMHCPGDTLSGHTFLSSSEEVKMASRTTEYLSVSPNPAVSGGEILLGRRSGEAMDVSGDAVLLSSDGVLIRRYRSEELLSSGGRLVLPSYLPPGMYYLNMRKRDSPDRYVAKVVVAE